MRKPSPLFPIVALVVVAIAASACGGGTTPQQQQDMTGSPTLDMTVAASCSCGAGEGCLKAHVTRVADTTAQPWIVWPMEADGVGTLIASAATGAMVKSRVTLAGADMKPVGADYTLDLGCLAAGSYDVRTFLDDNLTAAATDYFSGDYRDSCLSGARKVVLTIVADTPAVAELQLSNSCD